VTGVPRFGKRALAPCGTAAAARRHGKKGEPLCAACKEAQRLQTAERTGSAVNRVSEIRETRNGLPEFAPYVYRGTGKDTLTAYLSDADLAEYGEPSDAR
jgi:hypothetical protein